MASDHAKAFQLARHNSVRNEPDNLQEVFVDGYLEEESTSPSMSKEQCECLAEKMNTNTLPPECKQYPSVLQTLQRTNSNRSDHAVAFAGMSPGEAQAAMAAREKGHLNPVQIQRRLTHKSNSRRQW
mmetsp:Transcript_10875/g.19880  ORF Transcript_10875/g.19880 Transcript_10875/m.19880 type:complete len:127 (-) Transcript_10875:517-897(-)